MKRIVQASGCLLMVVAIFTSCKGVPSGGGGSSGMQEKPGNGGRDSGSASKHVTATLGGRTVRFEVADTPLLRGTGLADRSTLDPDCGMIFLYPRAEHRSFWMKGCRMSLDIAYLGDDRRIIKMGTLDPPPADMSDDDPRYPRLPSEGGARYVVEVRKGWFADHRVTQGDEVVFSVELERRASAVRF